MKTHSVKQSVIKGYSKLAKATQKRAFSGLLGCCGSTDNPSKIGTIIGYTDEELANVPQGSNLGVGCGNPSAFAKIKSGETVLDLGSGAGFDAFIISPIVGDTGKVIGVDLSDEMLSLARKNAMKGNYKNVSFVKGDIEQLPIADNSIDQIVSNCVINLSLDKRQVFKEAYRVLKKEGRVSISDIVLECELPKFIKKSIAAHIACISGAEKLEDYVGYMEEAGFSEIIIERKNEFPLELMLADPQLQQIAKGLNFNLESNEARNIASRVKSVSITAKK